jgi:ribosomal-protein-alanine N-acetyltransferase
VQLLTPRLRLRSVRLSDAPLVHEMATSKGVAVPAGHPTPKNLAATRKRLRSASALTFAIIRREDDAWLGLVNLSWPHVGLGQLGYSLHPRYWGNGYASEAVTLVVNLAFSKLGAHRVQATCWVKNPASAKVLQNAGLKKEGRLRGYMKRGRVVRDEFVFGLARADR